MLLGDVGRYLFWVQLRRGLFPAHPRMLERLSTVGAHAQWFLTSDRRARMAEEVERSFPSRSWTTDQFDALSHAAYALHVRCLLEELLLGKLTTENIEKFMIFEGRDNLEAALGGGQGVVLVFPHAGAIMLLIALLSLSGYDFTQVAARGFPPTERQRSADVRPTWFNLQARKARESAEDRLPAKFHGMDGPPRELYRRLENNGIIAIAFDGRGGSKFERVPYLNRTALLSSGPWRLAASTGAALVPAFCRGIPGQPHRLMLGAPIRASATDGSLASRAELLREKALRSAIEPWLEQHPDHYARWLLHCREHAGMDDHPLFEGQ